MDPEEFYQHQVNEHYRGFNEGKSTNDITNKVVVESDLSYVEAKRAIKFYESEYLGQNQGVLWKWAVAKAKGNL